MPGDPVVRGDDGQHQFRAMGPAWQIAEVEVAVATPLSSKSTTAIHAAVAVPTWATEPGLGDCVQRHFEVSSTSACHRRGSQRLGRSVRPRNEGLRGTSCVARVQMADGRKLVDGVRAPRTFA